MNEDRKRTSLPAGFRQHVAIGGGTLGSRESPYASSLSRSTGVAAVSDRRAEAGETAATLIGIEKQQGHPLQLPPHPAGEPAPEESREVPQQEWARVVGSGWAEESTLQHPERHASAQQETRSLTGQVAESEVTLSG